MVTNAKATVIPASYRRRTIGKARVGVPVIFRRLPDRMKHGGGLRSRAPQWPAAPDRTCDDGRRAARQKDPIGLGSAYSARLRSWGKITQFLEQLLAL